MMEIPFDRDPEAYHPDPGGHFDERVSEREIPPTAVRRCIESGDVIDVHDSGCRLLLESEYLQQSYRVVIDPCNGYLITAYRT